MQGCTREFAGVTLAVGDGEQLEAHRVILSTRSPVLRAPPAPTQTP